MKLKRAGIITKIVIVVLMLYAGISLLSLRSRVNEARQEQAALEAQVAEAMQENAELEYQIEHGDNPETIEDIARNKLGLVKPGEKIFYDVSN